MLKNSYIYIAILFFICNSAYGELVSAETLKSELEASYRHSAVSWWVVSQTEEFYEIEKRNGILATNSYKVSKEEVKILDVRADSNFPHLIKSKNVVFASLPDLQKVSNPSTEVRSLKLRQLQE